MPYPRGISPGRSTDAGRCCLADEARDLHSKHGRRRGRPTGRHSARCFFPARAKRNACTKDARRPGQPRKQKDKTLTLLVADVCGVENKTFQYDKRKVFVLLGPRDPPAPPKTSKDIKIMKTHLKTYRTSKNIALLWIRNSMVTSYADVPPPDPPRSL